MKFKIALTFLLLSFATAVTAQNRRVSKAELAYSSENYSEAAEKCVEVYGKLRSNGNKAKSKKANMAFKAADCYRFTERYREANEWYDRAILLDQQSGTPEVYLFNADMLHMMSEFDKSIKNYEEYLKLFPGDERAINGIQSCKMNNEFIANKTRHIIENQTALNKKEFDMAPMFGNRKMNKLYFSSGRDEGTGKLKDPRTGEGYMDLWISDKDKKGNWTEPYLVNGYGVNTIDNEGTVCFDSRYKQMFFTRCPNLKKENLGCDIWVSQAKGKTEWEEPIKIKLKSDDSVSVGHPATMDGKYLVFASDMSGGSGGRDLWYATYDKKTNEWSAPKNMGPEINTKGNELFPTFAFNGDLIFASDGLRGMGGLDIYRAARVGEENKWEKPTNIGAPINSTSNDYALIEYDNKNGYFTSERKSSGGEYNSDIYSYLLPPNVYDLKVVVSELGNTAIKIEDVRVVVTATDGLVWEGYTDDVGGVFWDKKPVEGRYINEESGYKINISKAGFHEDKNGTTISTVGLDYGQNFVIDMALLPKKPIRLPEVRYPLDKWDLLVDSTINSPDSLLFVFNLLEEYPGMILELSSHTDARGTNKANQKLSENRAKACYKYLVENKGVDPRRIVPKGKGELEPRIIWRKGDVYLASRPASMDGVEEVKLTEKYINSFRRLDADTFELLHQYNRRTEGKVITMDFNPETAPAADARHLKFVNYP